MGASVLLLLKFTITEKAPVNTCVFFVLNVKALIGTFNKEKALLIRAPSKGHLCDYEIFENFHLKL